MDPRYGLDDPRIPRDDVERDVYRTYLQSRLATWPLFAATVSQDEVEPGVWVLTLEPADADWTLATLLDTPTVTGRVWVGGQTVASLCWAVAGQANADLPPVIDWSAVAPLRVA